jgi:hypothetical protein
VNFVVVVRVRWAESKATLLCFIHGFVILFHRFQR